MAIHVSARAVPGHQREHYGGGCEEIIENLRNPYITLPEQRKQLDLVRQLDQIHQRPVENDSQLEAEIASFERAFKMQTEATDAFDISKETPAMREAYGIGAGGTPGGRVRPGKRAGAAPPRRVSGC